MFKESARDILLLLLGSVSRDPPRGKEPTADLQSPATLHAPPSGGPPAGRRPQPLVTRCRNVKPAEWGVEGRREPGQRRPNGTCRPRFLPGQGALFPNRKIFSRTGSGTDP